MEVLTAVDEARIAALRGRDEFFWLDMADPADDELALAGKLLGLHELAIEDTREFDQRPKLDRYRDTVLLVYWSASVPDEEPGIELVEVHLHISGGFVFTVRRAECLALDDLHKALPLEDPHAEDYILYRVLDGLTDAVYPVIDHLETRIDALEAAVLADTDRRQLSAIYRLKQEVQLLQRRIVPQRDQFGPATNVILSLPGFEASPREYLHDIGDHLNQLTNDLYRQTDDLSALTSTYFNANANRLNLLATRLTVIATFFLIWTLVTSFFGQNFAWLTDHVRSLHSFLIFGVGGLLIPTVFTAVYFWRRRREWQ